MSTLLGQTLLESDEKPEFYFQFYGVDKCEPITARVSFEKTDAGYSSWVPSISFGTLRFSATGYPIKSKAIHALEILITKIKESV